MATILYCACAALCALFLLGCASVNHTAPTPPATTVRKVGTYDQLKQVLENDARPGDLIEVQPGVYYATSPRITVRASGTPDKPIIIRGVGREVGVRSGAVGRRA